MSKRSNYDLTRRSGYGLLIFGGFNALILLFYMYGYLFDHTMPTHPIGLFYVAGVTVVSIGLGAIWASVDNWYSRGRE